MDTTQTPTLASLAGEAYDHFERVQRDEDTITTLKDNAPDWVRELVYAAHGDFLPDDWRYSSIRSALGAIHDADAETEDDLDELRHEFADSNVDVYTGSRLQWLASNLNRSGYIDQARDNGLMGDDTDITQQIGIGQYVESEEVFASVADSLTDQLAAKVD